MLNNLIKKKMINSVNALEFLKPKLLTMDKYNSTTTTKLLPASSLTQTRSFATIGGHQHNHAINSMQEKQTQFLLNDEVQHHDRVRVQHLENHTKLQNNKCWNNFRTLYNISASSDISSKEVFQICQKQDDIEIDVVNIDPLTSTSTTSQFNIQNKSAFNLDLNNEYHNNNSICGNNNLKIDSSEVVEANNNYKFYCNYKLINKPSPPATTLIAMSLESQATPGIFSHRTEDQNHAYRHIESVHNYAKLKSYEGDDDYNTSPNSSHHSSFLDDDEDDDEEDNDDAEYDNDDDIDYEDHLESKALELDADLDADYEDIFSKRRYSRFQKCSHSADGALLTKTNKIMSRRGAAHIVNNFNYHQVKPIKVNNKIKESKEEKEVQIDVDVETVESQSSLTIPVLDANSLVTSNGIGGESSVFVKPDHHARRPMNAFLIFCKRHRAIVKERYKNLENRAITKILGDWWASLDISDKKCFTSLAQQNKDAFFSANPNFKWYKLPAPPLRTLTTRPANAFGQEYQEDTEVTALEMISNNTRYNNNHSNYFKLADEAQMGDLSQLMQDKSKTSKQCADLQQVLGETSQFMSAHITGNSETTEGNHLKRRFHNENSFSSNSSEEDGVEPKKKSVRSCKGKRYQEFINSGQIATVFKKSKSSTRSVSGGGGDNAEMNIKQNLSNVYNLSNNISNNGCEKGSTCVSENMISYDLNSFDLEEKIKDLPALNLEDYLQRKRNTKKKKKFSSNGKKRGQRINTSNNNNNKSNNATNSNDDHNRTVKTSQQNQGAAFSNERLEQHQQLSKLQQQQCATAVGSQKRKARKESITRRDVSAIEQEVASLLPLTINGCCYFQEGPPAVKYIKTYKKDTEVKVAIPQLLDITSTSKIIPSSSVSTDILNNTNKSDILNDNISSSTSDLLILAEVAANRTELKH